MRVTHLWMTLCTVEKGGIMITSRAVIMSVYRAIFLSLIVLEMYVYETWSFPFISFFSIPVGTWK